MQRKGVRNDDRKIRCAAGSDFALSHLGVVAVAQLREVLPQARRGERALVPLLVERAAEEDVLAHAARLDPRLLRAVRDVRSAHLHVARFDRNLVDERVKERRLAGAHLADDAHERAARHAQRDVDHAARLLLLRAAGRRRCAAATFATFALGGGDLRRRAGELIVVEQRRHCAVARALFRRPGPRLRISLRLLRLRLRLRDDLLLRQHARPVELGAFDDDDGLRRGGGRRVHAAVPAARLALRQRRLVAVLDHVEGGNLRARDELGNALDPGHRLREHGQRERELRRVSGEGGCE